MPFRSIKRFAWKAAVLYAAAAALLCYAPNRLLAAAASINPGSLITPKGICPLKHTSVHASISGPLARVTVRQEFENPFSEKIEAVYTFPLPPDAAVDDMTMLVGDRTIRGKIKERGEARRIYENARRNGNIAGLLDQERPNVFTQAVANIMPGFKVEIEISYVETVPYEAGSYEFNFPMVVAPRYMPRRGVPDAERIASAGSGAATTRISLGCCRVDVVGIETNLIVNLALLRVAENVVGLRENLELLLGRLVSGIYVGMVLAREFAERLADLLRRGALLYPESRVVILLFRRRGHWLLDPPSVLLVGMMLNDPHLSERSLAPPAHPE